MRWRYLLIFFVFVAAFFGIVLKLFEWQVVQASELSQLGQHQYSSTITIDPNRGEIQTSDGFSIVSNKISYIVFANPKEIKNPDETSAVLAPILSEDQASISALLSLDRFWVALKKNVDDDIKSKITDLKLPGIGFQDETTRLYPEASMAASLLGFVGKDSDGNDAGYFGLEGYYDRQIRGRPGQAIEIHDAFGRPILSKINENFGEQDGRTIVLHVDRAVQFLVEQKLKGGIEKYGAASGMAAVMDPKTGAILSMANFPSFDPRSYWDYSNDLYKNSFITDLYEPGSTFKPIAMASAIDQHLVTPEAQCSICGAPVSIGGFLIHTWDDKYHPDITMTDVIIHSDNTGMVFVSQKLGTDKMIDVLNTFGMGSPTGIDLEGETSGEIKPRSSWYATDLATAAFGQGIAVTPIELLDGFSSIANAGIRMEPHVVDHIITPDGQTIVIPPKELNHTMSSATAKVMTEMLVQAVEKGEAQYYKKHQVPGYRIAGKTGTASIAKDGHYDQTNTIASFVGFAPADNPKFAMLVIINRPTASIYGAETAAPVFFDIAKDLLTYYNIAPTGE